jgi:hypothetical protein
MHAYRDLAGVYASGVTLFVDDDAETFGYKLRLVDTRPVTMTTAGPTCAAEHYLHFDDESQLCDPQARIAAVCIARYAGWNVVTTDTT